MPEVPVKEFQLLVFFIIIIYFLFFILVKAETSKCLTFGGQYVNFSDVFFICSHDIIVSDGIKGFSVFLYYSITVLRYRKINISGPRTGKQAISLSSVLSRHFSFVLILLWSTR